ncbi:MAG: hypothetical protein D6B26_02875 [Spirochaetaceae bacterium]|nr:MAG: hypothetical protein D6B26_02875 [Spirochaetaceae bacterium]
MLLFRLIAPILWLWLVRHYLAGWLVGPKAGRRTIIYSILFAIPGLLIYLFLRTQLPLDYSVGGFFFYRLLTDWLILLAYPVLLHYLLSWRWPTLVLSRSDAFRMQWALLLAVSVADYMVRSGALRFYDVVIFPLLLMALALLPPVIVHVTEKSGRGLPFRVFSQSGVFLVAAAAATGVQVLCELNYWVFCLLSLIVLLLATLLVVYCLCARSCILQGTSGPVELETGS